MVLTDAQKELLCQLKRDVTSRSLDRIIEIAPSSWCSAKRCAATACPGGSTTTTAVPTAATTWRRNRFCRAAFVNEVKASSIVSLDELNRAFRAWVDLKCNRREHGETGQTPWDRWRDGADRIVHVDERALVDAFLFRASRTTDKTGVLKLHGSKYQVGPELARKKVEVRYDPDRM